MSSCGIKEKFLHSTSKRAAGNACCFLQKHKFLSEAFFQTPCCVTKWSELCFELSAKSKEKGHLRWLKTNNENNEWWQRKAQDNQYDGEKQTKQKKMFWLQAAESAHRLYNATYWKERSPEILSCLGVSVFWWILEFMNSDDFEFYSMSIDKPKRKDQFLSAVLTNSTNLHALTMISSMGCMQK